MHPPRRDCQIMPIVTWRDTDDEHARLHSAVARNCERDSHTVSQPGQTCAAHAMLAEQTVLDRLLRVFRTRKCSSLESSTRSRFLPARSLADKPLFAGRREDVAQALVDSQGFGPPSIQP